MNTLKLISIVLIVSMSTTAMAQSSSKDKQAKAELNEKASKAARKAAKEFKKEGWQVSPGALPLEKQLDRAFMYELEVDDDMNPVHVVAEGRSIGENYDAAKIQAAELARLQIAGKIGSETTAMVDNLVANKQLTSEQAATVTTTMMESKSIFSQKLGRLQTVVECYRVLKNKNKEVLVRLVTKEAQVQSIAKEAIRAELEKKGVQLSDELKGKLSADK